MKDRITVQEAAHRLGVKDDAIRKRIQRGTLEHEKDPDGRVFVYLDATHDASTDVYKDPTRYPTRDAYEDGVRIPAEDAAQDPSYDALMESMVAQIDRLETEVNDWKRVVATRDEEIRRRDAILMTMAQRIPELESPAGEMAEISPEPRDAPETAAEGGARGTRRYGGPPSRRSPRGGARGCIGSSSVREMRTVLENRFEGVVR